MKLTILGSGTYQPELKRHSSSYLVQAGGKNIVFDFGRGALDQLMKLGIQYYNIDAIFVSHIHPDHLSEIISFLHIALAEPGIGKLRKKELTIYGPKGFKKTIYHILKAFEMHKFKPKYKIFYQELTNKPINISKIKIKRYIVNHSKTLECLAYRINYRKKVLAYSGDTDDCPGLRKAVKDANLAIIESSWPEKLKPIGHLSAEKVGKVAKEANVKKVILTHMPSYYIENFNAVKEVKKSYKGPIFIAKDSINVKI